MTRKQLIQDALKLPAGQRAKLARDIIASLDGPFDADAPKAWVREIGLRASEVREGSVALSSWKDVKKRLAKRLSSRR